jgi:hypothetical protein
MLAKLFQQGSVLRIFTFLLIGHRLDKLIYTYCGWFGFYFRHKLNSEPFK